MSEPAQTSERQEDVVPGKISLSELLEKLNDPDVSVDEVREYFREVRDHERPFSPSFAIDGSKVDLSDEPIVEGVFFNLVVGFLNRKHMRRRQRAYERRIRNGWPGLRLVAEGDSWFQYPRRRNDDLIDFLAESFAIYCVSAAGDELQDMLAADNRERIADLIRNTEAHGLLFSGGGNDIAGKEFVTFIRNAAPSEAADDYVGDSFDPFLADVQDRFRRYFADLFARFPDLRIFFHGYDHALPVADGSWLGPSLQRAEIPDARWAGIVAVMIDRYNASLAGLAAEFPGRLVHVSCVGAVGGSAEWRDELHSLPAGCERAAARFRQAITGQWPDAIAEAPGLELAAAKDLESAITAAAEDASDAPDLESASDEQRLEGDLIPDEDLGLDGAASEEPSSLESMIAEREAPIPPVRWPSDEDAPDYAHLATTPRDRPFELRSEDLERLIGANGFEPHDNEGTILFGLRGAQLRTGHQVEDAPSLELLDVRPNHLTFRCVIGFYDRRAKQLWAYTASTVPNALSMARYFRWQKGSGGKFLANMLPTGCYTFRRASHGWSEEAQKWKVPIALRLTFPGSSRRDGPATVLRSRDDLVYDTRDVWHHTVPADNIHPAFSTTAFSSAGCLTIRGSSERFTNMASEQWERFLVRISRIPKNGRIDLVLLTGAEAAIAADLRASGDPARAPAALHRLRVGSRGETVERLQRFLGTEADGIFGPATKLALTERQKSVAPLDGADGVYSPQMDAHFEQDILSPAQG